MGVLKGDLKGEVARGTALISVEKSEHDYGFIESA